MSNEACLSEVERIRSNNNVCWMGILQLALRHAPEEAKALLAEINKNDEGVTRLLREIAKS